MFGLLEALVLAGLLLGPLIYGITTLAGMRAKRVYPLLRLKRQDGTRSALTVSPPLTPHA